MLSLLIELLENLVKKQNTKIFLLATNLDYIKSQNIELERKLNNRVNTFAKLELDYRQLETLEARLEKFEQQLNEIKDITLGK